MRIVEGGFRPAVFLLPPAALLARKLWGACLLWLLLVGGLVGAAAAGVLSPWAALGGILVVHLTLAIDAPDMERRRLTRRGWSTVALVGPLGVLNPAEAAPPSDGSP